MAQCSSQEEVKLFLSLLQHSLSGEVDYLTRSGSGPTGSNHQPATRLVRPRLSRAMTAIGVRFRLVKMALGLLHTTESAYISSSAADTTTVGGGVAGQSDIADNLSTGSGTTMGVGVSTNVSPTSIAASGTIGVAGGVSTAGAASSSFVGGVGGGGGGLSGPGSGATGGGAHGSSSISYATALRLPPLVRLALREKVYSAIINYFR